MVRQNYSLHYYHHHEIFTIPSSVECRDPLVCNDDDVDDDGDLRGRGGGEGRGLSP